MAHGIVRLVIQVSMFVSSEYVAKHDTVLFLAKRISDDYDPMGRELRIYIFFTADL